MRSMPFIVNEVRNVWPRRVGDGEQREGRGGGRTGMGAGEEGEKKAEESGEQSVDAALEGR